MKRSLTFLINIILIVVLVGCSTPTAAPTSAPPAPPTEAAAQPTVEVVQPTTAPATFDFSGEFWNAPFTAQKEWVLGVSYQNLAFPYVAAMQKAIQNRAKAIGVKLIEADAFNDTNKELSNVENILAQKPDALLFEAASLEASVASIEAANKANIPVIQFNGKAKGGDYVTFVGSNQIDSGKLLGSWLADLYKKLGKDTLKGIYLRGVAGQITDIARHDGVVAALKDAGLDTKITFTEQYADYDRGKGQSVTESILSQSKDYDFIVANNDDMILGALAALEQAGLAGKMPACGVDGLPESMDAIKSGKLSATVFQNPEGQAAGGLTAAVAFLEGAKPDKEILIPFQLVTPDNVDKITEIVNRVYGSAAGTVVKPPSTAFDFSGEFWNAPFKAQKEWVLGVSYQNLAFPYVAAMQKAIQNRAKAIGVKLIEADAVNDTSKELANVENILAQKPDALLFEAASLEASVASIEAANKANIPVIQFNGKAKGGDYVTFVGSNQIDSGKLLGGWLADLYKKLGKDTLKGIYLRGVAGQITDIARHDGVVAALKDAGLDTKITFTEQYADYDRGKGQSVTESILSQSKEYDFIVANNDDMILGALAALEQAGLAGKMPACGVDGLPESMDAIKSGKLSATVFQNPEGQAAGGLTAAVAFLEGAKPDKEILIPFQLVTPDNVDKITEIVNRVYGAAAGTVVKPPSTAFDFSGEFWNAPFKAQKEWVLGVSYQNLAFPYVAAMQKAIQNRAKAIGVKLIEADAVNDTSKELANVENILAQKPDALLFEAASLEASVASIEAANKANIPVIQFNGKAKGGDYVTFVGSNQIDSGKLLGGWLADLYKKLGKDTLKGIYLRGVAGQITDIARHDGVVAALKDAGLDTKITFTEQYADYDRGKGQSVTESILSQSKDYDFIIANNDDMILGALAALEQAGLAGKMPACGVDGLPEALDAIKSGKLSATVFQNPEGQAAGGLTAAVAFLEGAKPDKEILIPFILVTPDNVDKIAVIANRVYGK